MAETLTDADSGVALAETRAREAVTRPITSRPDTDGGQDPDRDATPTADLGMGRTLASHPIARDPEKPLRRGELIGRYVIVDRLGGGGMGVVYRAFDPDLDRSIALKLVSVTAFDVAEERSRLLREAQAMARLSHPNVIPVFDVGLEQDAVFVAMELVDGPTLGTWVQQTDRAWSEILAAFVEAGRGLQAAHEAGLVHRDFKPDNVMVGADDRVRVLDFGLARGVQGGDPIEDEATAELRASSAPRITGGRSLEQSMTAAGTVMGTPAYMSPEQHLGVPAAAASDQFSFCVALWEALYGERPFAGNNLTVLSANVLQGKLRPIPSDTAVPSWVHEAIVTGLAVDDDKRHRDMKTLLARLQTDPGARRRRGLWLAAGALGILAAGGLVGAGVGKRSVAAVAAADERCTGAAAAIEPVWNDTRADALRQAFVDTALPYAPAVWDNAAARIEGWVATWRDGHTEACRATRVTGEQSESLLDRRMLCLTRQRGELDALLTALGKPDDSAVERTIDAVRRLPKVDRCADPHALTEGPQPPDDPELASAIEDAEASLAAVHAQVALGHYLSARSILAPVLATAEALDHPPLSAEAYAWLGDIEAASGSPAQARFALEGAFAAATAADDVALAAAIASELAYELGHRAADEERGQLWLSLGRALVRRGGADADQGAQLDSSEGTILVAAGDYREAIEAHERALAYWEANAPDTPSMARVLDDIGSALVLLGEIDRALENHERSLEIRRSVYGERHPKVALSEREYGMALSKANRDDEALEPLRRALEIHREARGEVNTHVAVSLDDIGRIERRRGNLDAALEHHNKALAIWEQVLEAPHPDLAVSLLNVGYTYVAAERPAEAVPVHRRALAMFEASVGEEHPYVIYSCNALGMALVSSGDPAAAIEPLQRSLSLRGKVEVDPTLFADTLYELGKATWRTATSEADRRKGLALAKEARDLFATQPGRWDQQIANIDAWRGQPG